MFLPALDQRTQMQREPEHQSPSGETEGPLSRRAGAEAPPPALTASSKALPWKPVPPALRQTPLLPTHPSLTEPQARSDLSFVFLPGDLDTTFFLFSKAAAIDLASALRQRHPPPHLISPAPSQWRMGNVPTFPGLRACRAPRPPPCAAHSWLKKQQRTWYEVMLGDAK